MKSSKEAVEEAVVTSDRSGPREQGAREKKIIKLLEAIAITQHERLKEQRHISQRLQALEGALQRLSGDLSGLARVVRDY